ncbi:MAG: hypothetical protein U0166_07050 [Acidobacteriota bacterium]
MSEPERRYRAGETLDDLCRACKIVREHRVLAVDGEGRLLRVVCGYCGSQHNYRGGDRPERPAARPGVPQAAKPSDIDGLVGERERSFPEMSIEGAADLEMLLRRVIREETGLTSVSMADKWKGGELVLRPFNRALQEKTWPIESFFHKVVMMRNRLRTLEQQVNASALPEDQKIKLQSYVTGCYGSLTSFNVLFAEEDDRFQGAGGSE